MAFESQVLYYSKQSLVLRGSNVYIAVQCLWCNAKAEQQVQSLGQDNTDSTLNFAEGDVQPILRQCHW